MDGIFWIVQEKGGGATFLAQYVQLPVMSSMAKTLMIKLEAVEYVSDCGCGIDDLDAVYKMFTGFVANETGIGVLRSQEYDVVGEILLVYNDCIFEDVSGNKLDSTS